MNEFGEITRSDNNERTNSDYVDGFSANISEQFRQGRKRNFIIITLLISTPCYAAAGFVLAPYVTFISIDSTTAAILVALLAALAVLIYDTVYAKQFEGIEFLIAILIPLIVAACAGLVVLAVYIIIHLIIAILIILIIIGVIAGLISGN